MSDKPLTIMIDDTRPNLKRLRAKDKAKFLEVVKTFMAIAEEAADDSVPIPWYELPSMLNPNMTMKMIASATLRAVFRADQLNKDTFSVLGATLHPLSHFGERNINRGGAYSSWQRYFMLEPDAEVNQESIEKVIRKLLYFSRYIDVEKFGHALLSNQIEAYKALGQENLEKLPFIPALRYQKEHFKNDLMVGQFWDDIGAFNCGEVESLEDGCPACKSPEFHLWGDYTVCSDCNAGFKYKAD
jgi:hypothetical protein